MSNKAESIKKAAGEAGQSVTSPCTTVCSTLNCQKPLRREETEKLLRKLVGENRNGMNELDAMAKATEDALKQGASIEDILNTFSTKSFADSDWWNDAFDFDKETKPYEPPIPMPDSKGQNSGLDPSIDDETYGQMGHIFAYIKYGYEYDEIIARLANRIHDPQTSFERGIRSIVKGNLDGVSEDDYNAGLRGASIGRRLRNGNFCLENFPDILKNELGLGGGGKQEQNIKNEFDKSYLDRGMVPPAPLPISEE